MIHAPDHNEEVSALVQVPVGMTVNDLRQFLIDNKVDPTEFGKYGSLPLEKLSAELMTGESALMVNPDGSVVRLVEVVVLLLTTEDGANALVEIEEQLEDGATKHIDRLPGIKRRPDENIFAAAQKLLRRHLHANENFVTINARKTCTNEVTKDSANYPAIKTIYRRRIVYATLHAQEANA
eukprot:TRINITY_DN14123_c0_g1_i2.p1 TRINITY_DN14123_c0_g1~~TRINITY_DN14123_c0_g1_i2.p1  ORF type:complete len:181 (+),score=41.59 TRINITY_DN14123_c0_g1_i2:343-885(+)